MYVFKVNVIYRNPFSASVCETQSRNGICYWIPEGRANFDDALAQCEQANGTLAVPEDQETLNFMA